MKTFDRIYIETELQKINKNLSKPLTLFILGGGAMSFYDLKTATKDIDVILTTEEDASNLIKALYRSGYTKIAIKDPIYIKMKTREIVENKDGFRWDIFVNKVCGGLTFSEEMAQRAKPLKQLSKIKMFLISPEDIFVFKAITSRLRDREDMFTLFSHGLDIELIKKEIQKQAILDENKAWISYFFIGLDELVKEYNIVFPDYNEFLRLAEDEMLEKLVLELIQRKPRSISDLVSILTCSKDEIKDILEQYIKQGKIQKSNGKFSLKIV